VREGSSGRGPTKKDLEKVEDKKIIRSEKNPPWEAWAGTRSLRVLQVAGRHGYRVRKAPPWWQREKKKAHAPLGCAQTRESRGKEESHLVRAFGSD